MEGGSEHFKTIDRLFHPRSVAVVGQSSKGVGGLGFLLAHQKQGFSGKLYAINPKEQVRDEESAYINLFVAFFFRQRW